MHRACIRLRYPLNYEYTLPSLNSTFSFYAQSRTRSGNDEILVLNLLEHSVSPEVIVTCHSQEATGQSES